MTAAELECRLPDLLRNHPESEPINLNLHRGIAVITVAGSETIACRCVSISLARDCLRTAVIGDLAELAKQLVERVTYLPAKLLRYEDDALKPAVLMRSTISGGKGQPRCYYELLVDRQHLHFTAYSHQHGKPREVISTPLTMDVLARLLMDFDEVLG